MATLVERIAKSLSNPQVEFIVAEDKAVLRAPATITALGNELVADVTLVTKQAVAFQEAVLIDGADVIDSWTYDAPVMLPPNCEWSTTLVAEIA